MGRFYGSVGYGQSVEVAPGVWEEEIVEREYYGDILRNSRSLTQGEKVVSDISVGNRISIVADAYALDHIFNMKYVVWSGARWIVSSVDVERPRLVLSLGGVYNGPTPPAS